MSVRDAMALFRYHVLLIGIDNYVSGNSLLGCVNDIDAVEDLLLGAPGIGIPAEQIHISRMAGPNENAPSSSRFLSQTKPPTRDNIVQALRDLGDPAVVRPGDRVLIYYAGHGSQVQWTTTMSWHEALVPQDMQLLYDAELNLLINAIATRTEDLTIVLDSCRSAGATRDIVDDGELTRFLSLGDAPVQPPVSATTVRSVDPSAGEEASDDRSVAVDTGLRSMDPRYVIIAACQADEKAKECTVEGKKHGWLTYGLLSTLKGRELTERSRLRWADIWPQLTAKLVRDGKNPQHPWLIGRSERRVFGGPWAQQDAGISVVRDAEGTYRLNAGTLMSVTTGTRLAVYGPEPALFKPLNSDEDVQARRGLLQVLSAGPSSSTAEAVGEPFPLPDGARCRVINPGQSARVQVSLEQPEETVATALGASPLLEILPPGGPGADLQVRGSAAAGWTIGNDVEPDMANVPPGQAAALRAGLEAYDHYAQVIRFAHNCNDAALTGMIRAQVIDCSSLLLAPPSQTDLDKLVDQLLEAPRSSGTSPYTGGSYGGNYVLPAGFHFAIRLTNTGQGFTLYTKVLLCTAGGKVQYLGDTSIRPGTREVLWAWQMQGQGWEASPSMGKKEAVDRLVVFATTRPDADLSTLQWDYNVQDIVNGVPPTRDAGWPGSGLPELWSAQIIPVVMTSSES